ncbi:uncharacterized protein V1510DRAFT_411444 [Dipodascopsis tothii]|uniref:uncharacterized protein n=1 Tax=Dipodascopsis tothii TaxID=44089 RepID=UPI0034CD251B
MANKVLSLQKFYQANTQASLYWRHPRSKFYMIPYWIGFTGLMGYTSYYFGRMVIGKKDKP